MDQLDFTNDQVRQLSSKVVAMKTMIDWYLDNRQNVDQAEALKALLDFLLETEKVLDATKVIIHDTIETLEHEED
jgi:hypothetical protein